MRERGDTPAQEMTGRLFVALWPEEDVRAGLAAWTSAVRWPSTARRVPAADLHLTLLFIGSIAKARLEVAQAALEVPAQPFELSIDTLAFWRGGLAVLMPSCVSESLLERQRSLAQAMQRSGLPFDARSFKPHVTLARRSTGAEAPPAGRCPPVLWRGHTHVLAMRDGGQYRILHGYA